MARFARLCLLVAAGLLVAGAASANIPDPNLSQVPDAITITPDASFAYTVIVNGAQGPVNGASVELRWVTQANTRQCWCVGQARPSIFGVTNASGQASFFVAGGGCIAPGSITGVTTIVAVFADGIELDRVEVNSPDVVNNAGVKCTATGYVEDANCSVGLSDAVYHTGPIANGSSDFCSNFTAPYNDPVAIGDAVIITPYIINGTSCVAQ